MFSAACAETPDHLPGGKAASKAAGEAGKAYGDALVRGITRGEEGKARSDLEAARRALEQFAADESAYPEAGNCAELASVFSSFGSLNVSGNDPWGSPYDCRSRHEGFTLRSHGPDQQALSADDIVLEGGSGF